MRNFYFSIKPFIVFVRIQFGFFKTFQSHYFLGKHRVSLVYFGIASFSEEFDNMEEFHIGRHVWKFSNFVGQSNFFIFQNKFQLCLIVVDTCFELRKRQAFGLFFETAFFGNRSDLFDCLGMIEYVFFLGIFCWFFNDEIISDFFFFLDFLVSFVQALDFG